MVQDEGGTRQPRRVTQHWEHDGKTRTCQELQGELVPTESRARGLLYCLYSLIAEKRNSRKLGFRLELFPETQFKVFSETQRVIGIIVDRDSTYYESRSNPVGWSK